MSGSTEMKPPPPAPPGWNRGAAADPKHRAFLRVLPNGRTIFAVVALREDRGGRPWHHLSVSVRSGKRTVLPTFDEFLSAKEDLLGVAAPAVQILPPRAAVREVLHLFSPVDGIPGVPEFNNERSKA